MKPNDRTRTDAPNREKPTDKSEVQAEAPEEFLARAGMQPRPVGSSRDVEAHQIGTSISPKLLLQDRANINAWLRGDSVDVEANR